MGTGNSSGNNRKHMSGVNNLTPSNVHFTGNFDFHDAGHSGHHDDLFFDGSENDGVNHGSHHYHKHGSSGMGGH